MMLLMKESVLTEYNIAQLRQGLIIKTVSTDWSYSIKIVYKNKQYLTLSYFDAMYRDAPKS